MAQSGLFYRNLTREEIRAGQDRMITLRQGNKKGQWQGLSRSPEDGGRTTTLRCPECGQPAGLFDHEIKEDGTVHPSVVCPYDGCSFHDYVRLEGWEAR